MLLLLLLLTTICIIIIIIIVIILIIIIIIIITQSLLGALLTRRRNLAIAGDLRDDIVEGSMIMQYPSVLRGAEMPRDFVCEIEPISYRLFTSIQKERQPWTE